MARFFLFAGMSDGTFPEWGIIPGMSDFLDFRALKRPARPNNWLVAPPGFADQAAPNAASPVFAMSETDLFDRIQQMVASRRKWKLKSVDETARQISFIAVTPLMHFKDDVDIAVLSETGDGDYSTLAIYSRSRIGHSDLGANAKRVNEILAALALP